MTTQLFKCSFLIGVRLPHTFLLCVLGLGACIKSMDHPLPKRKTLQNGTQTSMGPDEQLLRAAAAGTENEIINALRDQGRIETTDMIGRTALYLAAQNNHVRAVEVLLQRDAQIDAALQTGGTPLYVAAQNGHVAIVRILLEAGANKEVQGFGRLTPLHVAVQNGHLEVVQALLEARADIEAVTSDGKTPLDFAVSGGWDKIRRVLLEAGAQEKASEQDDSRPAGTVWAVRNGAVIALPPSSVGTLYGIGGDPIVLPEAHGQAAERIVVARPAPRRSARIAKRVLPSEDML